MDTIAAAVGGLEKCRDSDMHYWKGPDMLVAAAQGHLVELDGGKVTSLPAFPSPFILRPAAGKRPRLDLLKKLASSCTSLINACDAGREGENIFRRIVQFLGLQDMPSERLWLQSLTPAGIRAAFANLRSDDEMIPLARAAQQRQEADWLVGINATSGLWRGSWMPRQFTAGRVMTPTLAFVVDREREIERFKPEPYKDVTAKFRVAGHVQTYEAKHSTLREGEEDGGGADWDALARDWPVGKTGSILKDDRTQVAEKPPALFSLSGLQQEASRRYKLEPKATLKVAQQLYEAQLISYPRTDSTHLPEDYVDHAKELLETATREDASAASLYKRALAGATSVGKAVFDNKKIGDHFAIIPTTKGFSKLRAVKGEQRQVLELVAQRLVGCFLPPAVFLQVDRVTVVDGHAFSTKEKQVVELGYLEASGAVMPTQTDQLQQLPEGAEVALAEPLSVKNCKTSPPKRYTQAALLSAMEHCGRNVDDKALKEGLKSGIGTSATRADTIEKLIKQGFLEVTGRKGKLGTLKPDPEAMELIDRLRGPLGAPGLASAEMTAEWENYLARLEKGELECEGRFTGAIHGFVTDFVAKVFSSQGPVPAEKMAYRRAGQPGVIACGKYKGKKFEEVRASHPGYCRWVLDLPDCGPALAPLRAYLAGALAGAGDAAAESSDGGASSPRARRRASGHGVAQGGAHDDLASLSLADLKGRLKALGLRTSGKKEELVKRLLEAKGGGHGSSVRGAGAGASKVPKLTVGLVVDQGDLPDDIASLKVVDLQRALKALGLRVSGSKRELVERLIEARGEGGD